MGSLTDSELSSVSSQVTVEIHGRSHHGNEALCLEILGTLRRALTKQYDVKRSLYEVCVCACVFGWVFMFVCVWLRKSRYGMQYAYIHSRLSVQCILPPPQSPQGLYSVFCANTKLAEPILDLLLGHFIKFYEHEVDITPPIKLAPCIKMSEAGVTGTEPLVCLSSISLMWSNQYLNSFDVVRTTWCAVYSCASATT